MYCNDRKGKPSYIHCFLNSQYFSTYLILDIFMTSYTDQEFLHFDFLLFTSVTVHEVYVTRPELCILISVPHKTFTLVVTIPYFVYNTFSELTNILEMLTMCFEGFVGPDLFK